MESTRPAQNALYFVQKIVVGGLCLGAIGVMLTGVILRYVMVPITNALDMDAISFFWVEETGEMLLVWLALVGGAIGIGERIHFTVNLIVHKYPPHIQQAIYLFNAAVTAVFGGLLAWQGWQTTMLNWSLGTPAIGISLGWFYASTVAGGILIILYAIAAATQPPPDPLAFKAD